MFLPAELTFNFNDKSAASWSGFMDHPACKGDLPAQKLGTSLSHGGQMWTFLVYYIYR